MGRVSHPVAKAQWNLVVICDTERLNLKSAMLDVHLAKLMLKVHGLIQQMTIF
jgi:hypothetical protein